MKRIDFKKELNQLYRSSAKAVAMVDVPTMNYLTVDGQGDPNTSQAFRDAVEALYALAYTLKFMVKKGTMEIDYGVLPLEALWWADDMAVFTVGDKSQWKWRSMIMQPDFISEAMVGEAAETVIKKKKLPAVERVVFQPFSEGPCAQILHIGPFDREGPTIERLHAWIDERGERRGKHHEIYLSDTRRVAPEKWKTILRQPMTPRD